MMKLTAEAHSSVRRFCLAVGGSCAVLFGDRTATAADTSPPPPTPFQYTEPNAKSVALAGEFNGWSTSANPLRAVGDGRWKTEVPLTPGRYQYKFVVDGRWETDPVNPLSEPDGFGGKNSVVRVEAGTGALSNPAASEQPATAGLPSPSAATPGAQLRRWTTADGQSFDAQFLRVQGPNAVFLLRGREYPYPLLRLRPADQETIRGQTAAKPSGASETTPARTSAPGPAGTLTVGDHPLTEGEPSEWEIPLLLPATLQKVREAYGGRASTKARLFLSVPREFRPSARPYPILIVSATTDGTASSVGAARGYVPLATDAGWVVVAVDGEFGRPGGEGDSTEFRWLLVSTALDLLYKEWPKAKSWPLATGGVSGGGGYASHQALMLETKRAPFIGLFLAVSAHTPVQFTDTYKRTPYMPLHGLPIFLSVGENDTIAKPERVERSRDRMAQDGFRNLRYELFPGGPALHSPHLQAALVWFLEYGRKTFPAAFADER